MNREQYISILEIEVAELRNEKKQLIKYLESKIEMYDLYIDVTKSDLEELKYTMFASDKLKKTINENIKARNIYQEMLEKVRSGEYD